MAVTMELLNGCEVTLTQGKAALQASRDSVALKPQMDADDGNGGDGRRRVEVMTDGTI